MHPSQFDLATVYEVQLEVSSHYAFDRMPACHEDDGKPFLHKSPSDSSGNPKVLSPRLLCALAKAAHGGLPFWRARG